MRTSCFIHSKQLHPVDGWVSLYETDPAVQYDSKWMASRGWMNLFRMDGIQCIVLFFSSFCFPRLPFPSLPFPQSVLSRSSLLLQRSVAHSGASVRCSSWFQLRSHQPPTVAARSVSIHHSKLSWTHTAETNIFVSWFSVASFPVTFVVWSLEVVCLHVHRVGLSVQPRTLPFPYLFFFLLLLFFNCRLVWGLYVNATGIRFAVKNLPRLRSSCTFKCASVVLCNIFFSVFCPFCGLPIVLVIIEPARVL